MKRAIPFLVCLLLVSCEEWRTVEIEETAETVVEQGTVVEQLVGSMGFGDFLNMDISANQELQNSDIQKNHIEKAKLTLLRLTITDPPSGQDFTFLDSLEFFVESPNASKQRIAHLDAFEAGETTVDLELDDVELAPYATDDYMNVTAEVTGRRPDNDTTIEALMRIEVVAKL
ncbi:hypothetical protein D6833_11495 [Candidatus Parcubacteria bacterium]|nr:MAG: hypothetical protein D6833_11495 [Candidatus Parcubacteria bacterium]